jgi:hypothetical protein
VVPLGDVARRRAVRPHLPRSGSRRRSISRGDFPPLPGVLEADELAMIDGFYTTAFSEDTETLRTWSPDH